MEMVKMEKLILFSSNKCPECPPVIEKLENEGIKFRNVDISNSIPELKEFLKLRDTKPYFDKIKKDGYVGVPTLMDENGNFYNPMDLEDFNQFK
jgi:glutaredoxin-related protein